MPYEPEADPEADEEQEAPDIHTLKKNFELLHTNPNQGIYPLKQTRFKIMIYTERLEFSAA